jgi:hypothetical protein
MLNQTHYYEFLTRSLTDDMDPVRVKLRLDFHRAPGSSGSSLIDSRTLGLASVQWPIGGARGLLFQQVDEKEPQGLSGIEVILRTTR